MQTREEAWTLLMGIWDLLVGAPRVSTCGQVRQHNRDLAQTFQPPGRAPGTQGIQMVSSCSIYPTVQRAIHGPVTLRQPHDHTPPPSPSRVPKGTGGRATQAFRAAGPMLRPQPASDQRRGLQ